MINIKIFRIYIQNSYSRSECSLPFRRQLNESRTVLPGLLKILLLSAASYLAFCSGPCIKTKTHLCVSPVSLPCIADNVQSVGWKNPRGAPIISEIEARG